VFSDPQLARQAADAGEMLVESSPLLKALRQQHYRAWRRQLLDN